MSLWLTPGSECGRPLINTPLQRSDWTTAEALNRCSGFSIVGGYPC